VARRSLDQSQDTIKLAHAFHQLALQSFSRPPSILILFPKQNIFIQLEMARDGHFHVNFHTERFLLALNSATLFGDEPKVAPVRMS